jgi:4-hydroxy-tetrahydrodipicolinate synthase
VKLVAGSVPPLITPLHPDGTLHRTALERQLERLLGNVDAILVLGTTAEFAALPAGIADEVVDVTVGAVGGQVRLVLGVGAASTAQALGNLARVRPGITAVAATTPYYFPASPTMLERHYTALADASPVPLLLYNIPQNTHVALTADTVAALAAHPNIVGIKDSGEDVALFDELLGLRSDDFAVLQGSRQPETAALYRAGSDGFVAGVENVIPGVMRELTAAIDAGDQHAEAAAVARIASVSRVLTHGNWLAGLKVAVGMLIGGGDTLVAPFEPVDDAGRAAIRQILLELGLTPA